MRIYISTTQKCTPPTESVGEGGEGDIRMVLSARVFARSSVRPPVTPVSVHLHTRCLSNWVHIRWANSFCDTPGPINFWSGSVAFQLFPGRLGFLDWCPWHNDKIYAGVWPFRYVAVPVCGRFGLWFWSVDGLRCVAISCSIWMLGGLDANNLQDCHYKSHVRLWSENFGENFITSP